MKIAVFHNLPIGGAKRVLFEQVKGISVKHELEIFTYSENNDRRFNFAKYSKINKYKARTKFANRLDRDLHKFFYLDKLNKRIAKDINKKFDVCLVHADMHMEAPFILKHLSIPSLLYDQEMLGICYLPEYKLKVKVNFFKRLYENMFRRYLKYVDIKNTKSATKIVANSSFLRVFIKNIYKIKSDFIYPGVDAEIFKPNSKTKNNFLFVGNKGEYENWNMVAKALTIVRKKYPKVKLDVLNKNTKKFKINNDRDLAKKYSSVIATICTYSGETFGLKVVESMACETPVIAINKAAYPEVVVDNETGYLVKDSKEMAEKIEFLLNNPKKAEKMGKKGRRHVEKYSWESHVRKLENMLISLANDKD